MLGGRIIDAMHEDMEKFDVGSEVAREMRMLRAERDNSTPATHSALIHIALNVTDGALTHDKVERVNAYDGKN